MDWQHLLWQAWDLLKEHWLKALGSLVILLIGSWIGRRRARREWMNRRFLDRLNFSLNTIKDGKLQIRTLAEMNCRDVFLNDYAAQRVQEAAQRTTKDNAIVPLERDERWYILNAILNEVSERFAEGFLKRDMGLPVHTRPYLICLTYENAGELKTRKIRAMVIQKDVLLNLPSETPQLERPHHLTRFITLQHLATSYQADPTNFLEIEISL
jgi:hypothetical protein